MQHFKELMKEYSHHCKQKYFARITAGERCDVCGRSLSCLPLPMQEDSNYMEEEINKAELVYQDQLCEQAEEMSDKEKEKDGVLCSSTTATTAATTTTTITSVSSISSTPPTPTRSRQCRDSSDNAPCSYIVPNYIFECRACHCKSHFTCICLDVPHPCPTNWLCPLCADILRMKLKRPLPSSFDSTEEQEILKDIRTHRDQVHCILCGYSDGMFLRTIYKGLYIHASCALWTSGNILLNIPPLDSSSASTASGLLF